MAVKKILAQVPQSKIIFRDTTPIENRRVALLQRLKNLEIERAEVFIGADNFLEDYAQIDLILDTFPYNGGAMTALAIFMGVPVLNLRGEMHFSKLGADILRIAGLENFVAENLDDYIKKAVEFRRQEVSSGKLTDTKNFVASVYKKFEEIFK